MKKFVESELQTFAERAGQKLVFAAQRGGTAFGLGGPDSQTTVPFIYFDTGDYEFSLTGNYSEKNQSFRGEAGRCLYLGKDLRHFLLQMARSLPEVIEDLYSPIIFHQNDLIDRDLRPMANGYFCPKTSISHYLDRVSSFGNKWEGLSPVPARDYLESIRALLAAKWIVDLMDVPPVSMDELLENEHMKTQAKVAVAVNELRIFESNGVVERHPVIEDFFERETAHCSEHARRFPKSNYSRNTISVLYRTLVGKMMK